MTMDLETSTDMNGQHIPYLAAGYDGKDFITSYVEKQGDVTSLIVDFVTQIIQKCVTNKISEYNIYAHNLGAFDGILLFHHLFKFGGEVLPLFNNGKYISIRLVIKAGNKIFKNKKEITLIFKDSYLMLPLALRKLCKAFNVLTQKAYFPFFLKNIFYTGVLPSLEYWTDISQDKYQELVIKYTGISWNFKEEATEYCKLDCKALHEVLTKFNELIFENFKVNMTKCLTLPSLAMLIYKTNYMPADTIYQILDKVEMDIRHGYTGGAVDVYKTNNVFEEGTLFNRVIRRFINLYYYDFNSVYPYIMAMFELPVGKPVRFHGDIRRIDSEAYGWFYCKITSPEYIKHPILQKKIFTKFGYRTIAGLGTWDGWIFSSSMDKCKTLGYQFEIIKGYQFEKAIIFKDYVETMYKLRKQYPKSHPLNLIANLLMNSLYGKFGQSTDLTKLLAFDTSSPEKLAEFNKSFNSYTEKISDFTKVGNLYLLQVPTVANPKYDEELDMYHGIDVNIAIAAAITSIGRDLLSYFKNNPNFNLYYCDTDSAVIDRPLPDHMVGDKLGQLKLEHVVYRGIFLAPKVYSLITVDGEKITKVKGLSGYDDDELDINTMESLLVVDSSKTFSTEKWRKDVLEGTVKTSDVAYTLRVTSNKRKLITTLDKGIGIYYYDNTEPLYISDDNNIK